MKNAAPPGAPVYVSAPKLRRAIATCAQAGIKIGAVEIRPDGTVKIIASELELAEPANDFDRLNALGLL